MAADLNQNFSVDISKEGIHKKFSGEAVCFLKGLVKAQLSNQLSQQGDSDLKKHFTAINIKDSSKFSLPNDCEGAYPGFGNFSKTNGLMNLQYEYDLMSGEWMTIELTSVKRNDQQDSKQTISQLSKGGLYIRDLGYVTPIYLKSVIEKKAYFLNRMPPQANVYSLKKKAMDWTKIDNKFKKTGIESMDTDVLIYEKELLPCRLVIERVTEEESNKRIKQARHSAKRHGVGLSTAHKIRCRYNIFITNVSREILPIEKIRKTYYLRWQIELVFKTWKSFFEIDKVKKVKKERMECQLLAKLIWVLLNWQLFQTCNHFVRRQTPEIGISVLKFFKRCISFSQTLRSVVIAPKTISDWIEEMFLPLIENTACEAPVGKVTHYQTLDSLSCLS